MASTVTKLLPACGRCQMFVGICALCSRLCNRACLVDYNAQNNIGNGQNTSQECERGEALWRKPQFQAAACPSQLAHAPPCGQRPFALWCAHAETFRHRCGARSSKPVAGLAVCGRFDPYTSPPIKFLFRLAEFGLRFLPRFCRGFFVSAAGCAWGQPVAAGPVAELFV